METVRVVFISVPLGETNKLARTLVEKRLAACVNIIPKIESYFWWDDTVQNDTEALLLVKTIKGKFDELMTYVQDNHPYDPPEILALDVSAGLPEYLAWVRDEIHAG